VPGKAGSGASARGRTAVPTVLEPSIVETVLSPQDKAATARGKSNHSSLDGGAAMTGSSVCIVEAVLAPLCYDAEEPVLDGPITQPVHTWPRLLRLSEDSLVRHGAPQEGLACSDAELQRLGMPGNHVTWLQPLKKQQHKVLAQASALQNANQRHFQRALAAKAKHTQPKGQPAPAQVQARKSNAVAAQQQRLASTAVQRIDLSHHGTVTRSGRVVRSEPEAPGRVAQGWAAAARVGCAALNRGKPQQDEEPALLSDLLTDRGDVLRVPVRCAHLILDKDMPAEREEEDAAGYGTAAVVEGDRADGDWQAAFAPPVCSNNGVARLAAAPPRYDETLRLERKLMERVARDPESLSAAERLVFMHAIPCALRNNAGITAAQASAAIDDSAVDWVWLAHCNTRELNLVIFEMGAAGSLGKAAHLVDLMVEHTKYNAHTFVMFFKACLAAYRPQVGLERWRRWAQVRDARHRLPVRFAVLTQIAYHAHAVRLSYSQASVACQLCTSSSGRPEHLHARVAR
jgi:hypothetical protein